MSKPSWRGKPFDTPPSELTIERSARSFMSSTRRHAMRRLSIAEPVAPVDVVVDHGGEQVVRRGDGVEVAGEVQVDVLHRHHLGIAAARRAALDAEAGPERGLAQAHHRLLADAVERVAEADRRRRLALAGGRRTDGGDEDELAVLAILQPIDVAEGQLGLRRAVGDERIGGNADLGGHLGNRLHRRRAGNLDVGLDGHGWRSSQNALLVGRRRQSAPATRQQPHPAPILAV